MEQLHESRIDYVMKHAIETLVYRRRKRKSMSFSDKIGLVYENCEDLRYKVEKMDDYLGIKRVLVSSSREEEKKKRKKIILRGIYSSQILRRITEVVLSACKVLAIT